MTCDNWWFSAHGAVWEVRCTMWANARLLDVRHLVHREEDRDEKQEQHKDTVDNFENHLIWRESKFGKAVPQIL